MPPPPPPPPKSNTGLVVGLILGGVALVVVICVAAVLVVPFGSRSRPTSATPTEAYPNATKADRYTHSPTPPSPTARALYTLDSESTDRTPFELDQFFNDEPFSGTSATTYKVSASGVRSACSEAGGSRIAALMRKNGCGNMAVGVYLDSAKTVVTTVMVIPVTTAAFATNIETAFKGDASLANELKYFCPKAPEVGSALCDTGRASPSWYFGYLAYHRYMILSVALYANGRDNSVAAPLKAAASDCLTHVNAAIPRIR